MLKKLLILTLALCFFVENIVVYIVVTKANMCCVGDSEENDASESEEQGGKVGKKDEYKISSYYEFCFINDTLKSDFHLFDEKTYFEYCLEVNSPPPDMA